MFKQLIVAFATFAAFAAFAASVDVNKAGQAELESVKGIGPAISTVIVDERKKSDFKDWNDLVTRVKGVGPKSAAKFSVAGLTVRGASYDGAPMKTGDKPPVMVVPAKAPAKAGAATAAAAKK